MSHKHTYATHTHIYTHTLSHSPSLGEDEVFLQALEGVENVLEADREMEIGAQKEAETEEEADREMEIGAQKQPKETCKRRALKNNAQQPPAKWCTRRNTKLPDWNKSINLANPLGP